MSKMKSEGNGNYKTRILRTVYHARSVMRFLLAFPKTNQEKDVPSPPQDKRQRDVRKSSMLMRAIKTLFLVVLAAAFIGQLHIIILLFLYPIGGGALHTIFAYSDGGRLKEAIIFFLLNVGTASSLGFLCGFLRFPVPSIALGFVCSSFAWIPWNAVCRFPLQSPMFHQVVVAVSFLIPLIIFAMCHLGKVLSKHVFTNS